MCLMHNPLECCHWKDKVARWPLQNFQMVQSDVSTTEITNSYPVWMSPPLSYVCQTGARPFSFDLQSSLPTSTMSNATSGLLSLHEMVYLSSGVMSLLPPPENVLSFRVVSWKALSLLSTYIFVNHHVFNSNWSPTDISMYVGWIPPLNGSLLAAIFALLSRASHTPSFASLPVTLQRWFMCGWCYQAWAPTHFSHPRVSHLTQLLASMPVNAMTP